MTSRRRFTAGTHGRRCAVCGRSIVAHMDLVVAFGDDEPLDGYAHEHCAPDGTTFQPTAAPTGEPPCPSN